MSAGYGQDTWCLDALQPGRYATGAVLVAQAIYRRLITPRGTLRGGDEESAYGLDLSGYVGAVGYLSAVQALPSLVRAEIAKDDRVGDVDCAATLADLGSGGVSINLSLSVNLADESQSFTLTLAVTDVTTTLLGGLPQ